jgi:hypothetical protein
VTTAAFACQEHSERRGSECCLARQGALGREDYELSPVPEGAVRLALAEMFVALRVFTRCNCRGDTTRTRYCDVRLTTEMPHDCPGEFPRTSAALPSAPR